eukprot:TRINITY_DN2918_c0_g1_i2.p1 TRINITY_DN2918_c0_g1~~TRINITY_DN2918_c0_g1_i2.p1  ORF type:complete len:518 (+),score=68.54 TRINITY_DN2918_c0_g1_i2:134-1555(+)
MAKNHYVNGMPKSFRYEPQTSYWGNLAGHMEIGEGYSCGAKEVSASQGLATWQKWYDAAEVQVPTISPGQEIAVQITITADHGGQSWFMIACDDHIGEDVQWTYLERAKGDRHRHFMRSNPAIYAWAPSEVATKMGNQIHTRWVVPQDFTCAAGRVVGRWLWKTGSSCNDFHNIGRKTETFTKKEFRDIVHAFQPGAWVLEACTAPPETFISCFDFVMAGAPGPDPPSPTPSPSAPTPPPTPSPPPPSPVPRTPTCCWSNWGDDRTCGEYAGPAGKCNTDPTKKCIGNGDCPKGSTTPVLAPPAPTTPPTPPSPRPPSPSMTPTCCWSNWGDDSTCRAYTGQGPQCNTDHARTCSGDSDCPSIHGPLPPTPTPPPTQPSPAPPSPSPSPSSGPEAVNACHDAAKDFCTTKGGYCKACQAWGNWGDMFFVAVCNDDPSTCHQPIQAAGNLTCFCQKAAGCSVAGATCDGPSFLI